MSTSPAAPATTDPRFPIGRFDRSEANYADHPTHIAVLAALPQNLRAAVDRLSDAQLNTPYRDGGWTVRQLVHHIADSHMNAFVRIRLALTEDWPTIKPYEEKLWAELPDHTAPIDVSLILLDGLHARWALMLRSLTGDQWQRGFVHPAGGRQTVAEATALYSWHSLHHTAHITELRKRSGW
jgi:uncharacterized damage-inducible protein DinB